MFSLLLSLYRNSNELIFIFKHIINAYKYITNNDTAVIKTNISNCIDLANARIEFENGCVANITSSRISEEPMRKMRIFEKQSYASLNFQNQTCEILKIDGRGSIKKIRSSQKKSNALYEELKSFIECIKNGLKPIVCEKQGFDALDIAIKIQKIIENKK